MRIADYWPVDLISVDSVLVYRDMNIGSAKPGPEELQRYPHGLVDIRDPDESWSVADFVREARQLMQSSLAAGRIPVLVGGTMMYFRSLLDGLSAMPSSRPEVRQSIEQRAASKGWPHVHAELAEVDPEMAARIHPEHSQRICRALEIWEISGRPMSELQQENGPLSRPLNSDYRPIQIGLNFTDRALLHDRINRRFELMLRAGLIDEVRGLLDKYELSLTSASMRAVGYRQALEYLLGHYDADELLLRGQAATRQLAKRQLTWMRGWTDWQEFLVDGSLADNGKLTDMALHYLQSELC